MYTNDPSKEATYALKLKVSLVDYPTVFEETNFSVVIGGDCVPHTVTASSPPANVNYLIGDNAFTTTAFAEFPRIDPSCDITYHAANSNSHVINFDAANRIFTIYGTDIAQAGAYHVQVKAYDVNGDYLNKYFQFLIDIVDPCANGMWIYDANFINPNRITVNIGPGILHTETFPNTLGGLISFNTANSDTVCPSFSYSVVADSPIDSSLWTFTAPNIFTVHCTDLS